MKIKLLIDSLSERINNSLVSPEKKIMGKWNLFEYYTEPGTELVHLEEQELQAANHSMQIHFKPEGKCVINSNFKLPVLNYQNESFEWEKHRNYISFFKPVIKEPEILFQFAFDKNTLKLLKKNKKGKIQFFGFFRKPIPSKQS